MEIINSTAQDLESAISVILSNYDDINREGLKDSPKRIIKAYNELLKSELPKISIFESEGYDQMILDKNIDYYTFCEHHFLPFFGNVTIAYLPDGKIIGLSKLSRIVEHFSKRLNTQEYFTENIANYLYDILKPKGVAVYVTGRHLCKEMRGIKKKGIMATYSYKGEFQFDKYKNDFLKELEIK